jgi:hypothetical protein
MNLDTSDAAELAGFAVHEIGVSLTVIGWASLSAAFRLTSVYVVVHRVDCCCR